MQAQAQVYIGFMNPDGYTTTVAKARTYQAQAYNTFMTAIPQNPYVKYINFVYPDNVIFNIIKFDTSGSQEDHTTYCTLETNDVPPKRHILSTNEEQLKVYTGWRSRLMDPRQFIGGRSIKKSNNKKKSNKKTSKSKYIK